MPAPGLTHRGSPGPGPRCPPRPTPTPPPPLHPACHAQKLQKVRNREEPRERAGQSKKGSLPAAPSGLKDKNERLKASESRFEEYRQEEGSCGWPHGFVPAGLRHRGAQTTPSTRAGGKSPLQTPPTSALSLRNHPPPTTHTHTFCTYQALHPESFGIPMLPRCRTLRWHSFIHSFLLGN